MMSKFLINAIKVLFVIVLLSIIAVGLWKAVGHQINTSPQVARKTGSPIPVQTAATTLGAIKQFIAAEGLIKQSSEIDIRAKSDSKISSVKVQLGDVVSKGQVLLTQDTNLLISALDTASVMLERASTELNVSANVYEQTREMFNSNLVSSKEMDSAKIEWVKARSEYVKAKENLAKAKDNLKAAKLVAPTNGLVITLDAYEGMIPKKDAELVTLVPLDSFTVQCEISEVKYRLIHIGQTANISFYAFPGKAVEGSVIRIDPEVNEKTGNISVQVGVKNQGLELRPGMRGIVHLIKEGEGVRVPLLSLINVQGNRAIVFVDDNGIAKMREVELGLQGEKFALAVSGLKQGEKVVVVGQAALNDGDKLRIGKDYEKK